MDMENVALDIIGGREPAVDLCGFRVAVVAGGKLESLKMIVIF